MTAAIVAIVLAAASPDWALVVTVGGVETGICAKSQRTCETARTAIREGLWPIVPQDTPTACVPRPGCFPPSSLVIKGYNDR